MQIEHLPKDKQIILFDGVCNLCESSVQFIIKRDKNDVFRFVAIQSELGHYKAEAALQIAKEIKGFYALLGYFNFIPNFIKNTVYDYIAKNRYKWYGKKEACMIPTPELKAKFL